MFASKNGLVFSKADIAALLKFTSSNPEKPHLQAVELRVSGDEFLAYATDGIAAVEACAPATKEAEEGVWVVTSRFLDDTRKLIPSGGTAVVEFRGGKVHRSVITDKDGDNARNYGANDEHELPQQRFPAVQSVVKLPNTEHPVPIMTLAGELVARVALMEKAASTVGSDFHFPSSRQDPVGVEVATDLVRWRAVFMPRVTQSSTPAGDIGGKKADDIESPAAQINLFGEEIDEEPSEDAPPPEPEPTPKGKKGIPRKKKAG